MSGKFLLSPCFIEMPVVNSTIVDPAASDLGLHCLPMPHLWDARHKWVNNNNLTNGYLRILIDVPHMSYNIGKRHVLHKKNTVTRGIHTVRSEALLSSRRNFASLAIQNDVRVIEV